MLAHYINTDNSCWCPTYFRHFKQNNIFRYLKLAKRTSTHPSYGVCINSLITYIKITKHCDNFIITSVSYALFLNLVMHESKGVSDMLRYFLPRSQTPRNFQVRGCLELLSIVVLHGILHTLTISYWHFHTICRWQVFNLNNKIQYLRLYYFVQ